MNTKDLLDVTGKILDGEKPNASMRLRNAAKGLLAELVKATPEISDALHRNSSLLVVTRSSEQTGTDVLVVNGGFLDLDANGTIPKLFTGQDDAERAAAPNGGIATPLEKLLSD